MTTLIVAAVVVAWLFVGVRYTAPRAVARSLRNYIAIWEAARGKYTPEASPAQIAEWRREAVADNILMVGLGPLPLLLFALYDYMLNSAPLTDIELKHRMDEQQKRMGEQRKRIDELEKELGIDSRTGSQRARDRRRGARERHNHTP